MPILKVSLAAILLDVQISDFEVHSRFQCILIDGRGDFETRENVKVKFVLLLPFSLFGNSGRANALISIPF